MKALQIDQRVQVVQDIPELELHCGDVGTVCSTWMRPTIAYEVEFRRDPPFGCLRALLMPNQIRAHRQVEVRAFSGRRQ